MVFYKKQGYPSIKDIVLCKVKKILPHSVFVELLEYENKEGMIHISELSNKWTRNINEIISLNSVIVCRVEKIDETKGYIDLSKKRVISGEEKSKKDEIQKENHIEKIIEHVFKKNNISIKDFYEKIGYSLIEDYGSLYSFYESYLEDNNEIEGLDIKKELKEELKEAFESLVQKSRVTVKKTMKFYALGSEGLNNLKSYISELLKFGDEDTKLSIKYLNSPEYLFTVNSSNYKKANIFFDTILSEMKKLSSKYKVNIL